MHVGRAFVSASVWPLISIHTMGGTGIDSRRPRRRRWMSTRKSLVVTETIIAAAAAAQPPWNPAALRQLRLRRRFRSGGKWPDRGWLVMLRARDRRSLVKRPRWLAPLEPCCRRRRAMLALRNTFVVDTAAVSGDGGDADALLLDADNVERCEEGGTSSWDLARAVKFVVEMEEEGLFRNIVTYL